MSVHPDSPKPFKETVMRRLVLALALLIAAAPSDTATRAEQRQPPLSFSMSGLAG